MCVARAIVIYVGVFLTFDLGGTEMMKSLVTATKKKLSNFLARTYARQSHTVYQRKLPRRLFNVQHTKREKAVPVHFVGGLKWGCLVA